MHIDDKSVFDIVLRQALHGLRAGWGEAGGCLRRGHRKCVSTSKAWAQQVRQHKCCGQRAQDANCATQLWQKKGRSGAATAHLISIVCTDVLDLAGDAVLAAEVQHLLPQKWR